MFEHVSRLWLRFSALKRFVLQHPAGRADKAVRIARLRSATQPLSHVPGNKLARREHEH